MYHLKKKFEQLFIDNLFSGGEKKQWNMNKSLILY